MDCVVNKSEAKMEKTACTADFSQNAVEKPVEFVEKSGGFSRKLLVENSFSVG